MSEKCSDGVLAGLEYGEDWVKIERNKAKNPD
jgi:hypothetical protein